MCTNAQLCAEWSLLAMAAFFLLSVPLSFVTGVDASSCWHQGSPFRNTSEPTTAAQVVEEDEGVFGAAGGHAARESL